MDGDRSGGSGSEEGEERRLECVTIRLRNRGTIWPNFRGIYVVASVNAIFQPDGTRLAGSAVITSLMRSWHDRRRVKHEPVDALGRYDSQEGSYDTLLASNLTVLVKIVDLPDAQTAIYLSDLQLSRLANVRIWTECSSKYTGQSLEVHLESGVVSGGRGGGSKDFCLIATDKKSTKYVTCASRPIICS